MKEDTTPVDPTWMERTGGYARDMTLRDHFAGLFMQNAAQDYFAEDAATFAYEYADAMLKARAK